MTRPPRLITELVGTFIFLSVIALSGPAGPLAIGTALMAMVYMGGHISGAHYNPAVSFGAFLSRKLGAVDMAGYWVAQLVGAALAFTFGYLVSNHSPGVDRVRKWRLVGLVDLRRRSVHRGSDRSRHPPPAGRRRGSTMMKSPTGSPAGRAADRAGRR